MIVQCKSCSRKFVVKESDIPESGREVQCGYCSVSWHQMPVTSLKKNITVKKTAANNNSDENDKNLSVDSINFNSLPYSRLIFFRINLIRIFQVFLFLNL